MRTVLIGPPGSGKGTQGRRLAADLGVPHVSSGELLRASVERGDPYGVGAVMARGELVDDETLRAVVLGGLTDGFVLDGYPRTAAQARALDEAIAPASLDLVLELVVPEEELTRRLLARSAAGRADDTAETITARFLVYEREAAELREHYGARLTPVDGTGSPDDVSSRLLAACRAEREPGP